MLKFDELPSTPENDRIMVLPDQPKDESDGGIAIPDIAMRVGTSATILDAGLRARDVLYDNGAKIGDKVLFGQFAGVWEEWDHLIKDGSDPSCDHDWAYDPTLKGFRRQGRKCGACGAQRMIEPVLIMNVGDILSNISKAERLRNGELRLVRAAAFDGRTTHVYRRWDDGSADALVSIPATVTMTNGANKNAS